MVDKLVSEGGSEEKLEIVGRGYTIMHAMFKDELTISILSFFLVDQDRKATAAEIGNRCKASQSTAFRRLSELNRAGLLNYRWKITGNSPPKAVKEYYMPDSVKDVLTHLFVDLRESLLSKLVKP